MRITNNLIKQVVSDVAGEDVVSLVLAIRDKKNISEFKIAELVGDQINVTRNKLYRLFDNNLITFVRKKDRKKGWYIYYWTFNEKQIKFIAIKLKKERLERLRDRLARETSGQFYLCQNKCIRLDFEQATNFDFKCPECGSLIELEDNTNEINRIKYEIAAFEKSLHENLKEMGLLPRPTKPVKTKQVIQIKKWKKQKARRIMPAKKRVPIKKHSLAIKKKRKLIKKARKK